MFAPKEGPFITEPTLENEPKFFEKELTFVHHDLHSFCSSVERNVQATILLTLLPVPMVIVLICWASVFSSELRIPFRLDCLDTKEVYHKQFLGKALLSQIIF